MKYVPNNKHFNLTCSWIILLSAMIWLQRTETMSTKKEFSQQDTKASLGDKVGRRYSWVPWWWQGFRWPFSCSLCLPHSVSPCDCGSFFCTSPIASVPRWSYPRALMLSTVCFPGLCFSSQKNNSGWLIFVQLPTSGLINMIKTGILTQNWPLEHGQGERYLGRKAMISLTNVATLPKTILKKVFHSLFVK